ncbi:MAG: Hpt domain-containing protein [Candidatus Aminicenantales bacterium]
MTADSQNSKSPIDLSSVLERIGGDESFLQELLNLYTEDFSEKFEELKQAIDQQNFEAIQKIGHTLKGSSANLSLNSLQEASFEMEKAGREKNIEMARQTLSLLDNEFQRLREFLKNKL